MSNHMQTEIPFLVAGVLPEAERREVEAHLATCETCQTALREWQLVANAVRSDARERAEALPPLEPLLALISAPKGSPLDRDDHQQSDPLDQTVPVPKARSRRRRLGGLAGLLLLLLVSLLGVTLLGGGLRQTADRAGQRFSMFSGTGALGVPVTAPGWQSAPAVPAPIPTIVARRLSPALRSPLPRRTPDAGRAAPAPVVAALNPPAAVLPGVPTAAAVGSSGPVSGAPAAPAVVDNHRRDRSAVVTPVEETPLAPLPTLASPTPLPAAPVPATGVIAGRITGPDGGGRAEVQVIAAPIDSMEQQRVSTYTDLSGDYALTVRPGRWSVYALTPGYRLQWYNGRLDPFDTDALDIAAGGRTANVDFALRPNPAGRVTGRVTRPDGTPIDGALVMAVARDAGLSHGLAPAILGVAITDADGTYRLYLEPGTAALGASAVWSPEPAIWWKDRSRLAEADPVVVTDAESVVTFDFVLEVGPSR
jgi:anti-sigma factor RsiW